MDHDFDETFGRVRCLSFSGKSNTLLNEKDESNYLHSNLSKVFVAID